MENLTAEQILEGNRAIAEFMGYENQCEDWCGSNILEMDDLFGEPFMRPFDPDKRWDDLMPVVEKISRLHLKYSNAEEYYYPYPRTFGMLDEDGNFMVRLNSEPLFTASTLIEATYLAVLHIVGLSTTENSTT